MNARLRRGCLVGGLLAVAIVAPLVYDDDVLHHNGGALARRLGHGADAWIPLLGADLQDQLRVGFGLVLLVAILRAYARGRGAWAFVLAHRHRRDHQPRFA